MGYCGMTGEIFRSLSLEPFNSLTEPHSPVVVRLSSNVHDYDTYLVRAAALVLNNNVPGLSQACCSPVEPERVLRSYARSTPGWCSGYRRMLLIALILVLLVALILLSSNPTVVRRLIRSILQKI